MNDDGDTRPGAPRPAESLRPGPPGAESLRPRPQYGEYATPDVQRAHIRQPDPRLQAAMAPAPVAPSVVPASAVRPARMWDRIVTIALLVYGLVSVLYSVPQYLDPARYAHTLLAVLGVDAELSDPASARGWGIAAVVVLTVGWLATAFLSWRNVRAGRLAWWIPVVGGVVCSLIAGVLLTVPIMSDPAAAVALQKALVGR